MNRKFFLCFVSRCALLDNKDNFNGNQCCAFHVDVSQMIRQTNEIEISRCPLVDLRCASTSSFSGPRTVKRHASVAGKDARQKRWAELDIVVALYVRVCQWVFVCGAIIISSKNCDHKTEWDLNKYSKIMKQKLLRKNKRNESLLIAHFFRRSLDSCGFCFGSSQLLQPRIEEIFTM